MFLPAVHGLSENDTVTVRYSTEDGQIVESRDSDESRPTRCNIIARLADDAEGGVNARRYAQFAVSH